MLPVGISNWYVKYSHSCCGIGFSNLPPYLFPLLFFFFFSQGSSAFSLESGFVEYICPGGFLFHFAAPLHSGTRRVVLRRFVPVSISIVSKWCIGFLFFHKPFPLTFPNGFRAPRRLSPFWYLSSHHTSNLFLWNPLSPPSDMG